MLPGRGSALNSTAPDPQCVQRRRVSARRGAAARFACALALAHALAACGDESLPLGFKNGGSAFPDASVPPPQTATVTASAVDTRFVTREHFIASSEM